MRVRPTFTVAVFVLVGTVALTACGGGDGSASSTAPRSTPTTSERSSEPEGAVDCAAVRKAAADMIVPLQLIAQMSSPDQVDSIKANQSVPLDLDGLLAALGTLHQLDGYDQPPFGSPKPSIDDYEKAAQGAKALLSSNQLDQASVEAFYRQDVVSPSAFLTKQAAISAAVDAARCP